MKKVHPASIILNKYTYEQNLNLLASVPAVKNIVKNSRKYHSFPIVEEDLEDCSMIALASIFIELDRDGVANSPNEKGDLPYTLHDLVVRFKRRFRCEVLDKYKYKTAIKRDVRKRDRLDFSELQASQDYKIMTEFDYLKPLSDLEVKESSKKALIDTLKGEYQQKKQSSTKNVRLHRALKDYREAYDEINSRTN
ncbi:MAG: hypothetical protein GY909_15440 [Oligoflexia bacterium]|nr:hypothetical protein [Oligoflexia bacterium]